MTWLFWLGAVLATGVAIAALAEAWLKRGRKRNLVDMRPDPATLRPKSWEAEPVTVAQTHRNQPQSHSIR